MEHNQSLCENAAIGWAQHKAMLSHTSHYLSIHHKKLFSLPICIKLLAHKPTAFIVLVTVNKGKTAVLGWKENEHNRSVDYNRQDLLVCALINMIYVGFCVCVWLLIFITRHLHTWSKPNGISGTVNTIRRQQLF